MVPSFSKLELAYISKLWLLFNHSKYVFYEIRFCTKFCNAYTEGH